MPASSSTDAPKHFSNIRRTRPSYSCENCRSRRVKCDQVHPKCGNCARNQVECVYSTVQPKRKSASGQFQQTQPYRKTSRQRSDEFTDAVQQGYLVTQPDGRSRYIEKTFWASADSEGLDLDSLLADLPIFPDEGEDDGEDEVEYEAVDDLPENSPSTFWLNAQNRVHDARICPKQRDLLKRLPPEQTCIKLYQVFLEGVHPLIPLIHITSFEQSFKRFWQWHNAWNGEAELTGILTENPSFLPLLFAVLFTGSLARTKTDNISNDPLDTQACATTVLYKLTLASLTLVAFPQNPGLHSLMAYVLVNAMLIREEEALSSCSFVALSIRIAQAMGLHKDGSSFKLDAVQVEERRRLWAQLMHLDVMTACFSGLPLVAHSEMYSNTRVMSELRDDCIESGAKDALPEDSTQDKYPGYLLALGRYEASTMMRRILLRQFAPEPLRLVHINSMSLEIQQLKAHLDKRIARLRSMESEEIINGSSGQSSLSTIVSLLSRGPSMTALIGWSVNLLELMIEKAYCVLYQPIISDRDIWHEIRTQAIPHYQNYIRIYECMSTSHIYQPFQWLYPQSYQPLHPTAVLLIDCMKESNSAEMAANTEIIRSIFALVGPGGRITNGSIDTEHGMSRFRPNRGANRAWDRLERLRSRLWHRLGLKNIDDLRLTYSPQNTADTGFMPMSLNTMSGPTQYETVVENHTSMPSYKSPDGLLFDELQSFSQTWFPNTYYSLQDPLAGLSGSAVPQANFMMPEAMQYGWDLGTNLSADLQLQPDNLTNSSQNY